MSIDIHCHLTDEEFQEVGGVNAVVLRAKKEGVELLVCSGYDLPSSLKAKEIADAFENVYFCAGFHPSELKKYHDGDFEVFKTLWSHEKCVAVGEIGFDLHFEDNFPKERQREFFLKQMELADEAGLPVVIHSRDAASETLEFLREQQALLKHGGLLHCYSYSPEMLSAFAELGLYFSFGGPATFKNASKVQNSVKATPIDRILTETDCPYLTPVPYRGVFPNEPKNVQFVVEKLAELKNKDVKEFEKQVKANAKRLFFKIK